MTFIRKNFGVIIFYLLIVSLAFLYETPKEQPVSYVDPSQNLVVVNNQ